MKTNIIELKKLLVERGLEKIVKLAYVTGIDRNTLGTILSGKKQPSATVMNKLMKSLNMSSDEAVRIFFN